MLAATLVLLLAAPWEPAAPPAPTVWARAGARTWATCGQLDRHATASLGAGDSDEDKVKSWDSRVRRCPNVPSVLVRAAEIHLAEQDDSALETLDDARVERVAATRTARLEQALGWVDRAIAESARRADLVPLMTHYTRAYLLMGLGRHQECLEAVAASEAAGDVDRWRTDRIAAVAHLLAGDLDRALARAHRSVVDATYGPGNHSAYSQMVYALVLDRAGNSAEAERILAELGNRNDTRTLLTVEHMLPIHERLYLRALDRQARKSTSSALALWKRYLSRPEPEAPERKLAQRHQRELLPRPAPVEGPGG